jgi:dTDP-glucose 4,6-dehydratase
MKNILITGGAGFIGSHVIRLFVNKYSDYNIFNLDKLTYAGNLENLTDVEEKENYTFIKGDICDDAFLAEIFDKYNFHGVIHLAAESHVDRSISDPMSFIRTNIVGTVTLLNAAKNKWKDNYNEHRFYHISTDEVYGSLGAEGYFYETTPYSPRSPYSASKASSDHLVRAYNHTYGMNTVISNCSNNYGPNQFPEKLIPLIVNNIKHNIPLPVYGKGENVRDWLYVEDHAQAIDLIFHKGKNGETYNIGGDNEWTNIKLVQMLCAIMDKKLGRTIGESEKLITYVKDRAGHDLRYAIDFTKIKNELGWTPKATFETGLEKTVDWYLENENWMKNILTGEYEKYYINQYQKR